MEASDPGGGEAGGGGVSWAEVRGQYGVKRMDPWLALIGPGAGRRKEAVKSDVEAGGRG